MKSDNTIFFNTLSNKNEVLAYFKNKIRFELNINTKIQIRNLLSINSNNLLEVLNSDKSPITTILDEAISHKTTQNRQSTNLKDYERELLLKECEYNLSKVESIIRLHTSKTHLLKNNETIHRIK